MLRRVIFVVSAPRSCCCRAADFYMSKTAKEKEAVLNVFAAMLRPLIAVAFEYGVSAAEISRLLKRVYVQALERTLADQGRPASDARLAIMAGLSGSDVASVRAGLAPQDANAGVTPERIGYVLTTWNSDNQFAGAYGVPLDLPLIPVEGRPSFHDLVEVACPGSAVNVDVLLDSLIAAKSVEVVDGVVRCLSRAYVTGAPDANRIEQIGRFTELVISTFSHNLLRSDAEPSYFERMVFSDERLSEAGRDAFLAMVGTRGPELLFEIDNALVQLDSSKKSETGKRYGMGIYFFEDPFSDEPAKVNTEPRGGRPPSEKVATEPQEIDVLAGFAKKN
jgi:hypothetical protein